MNKGNKGKGSQQIGHVLMVELCHNLDGFGSDCIQKISIEIFRKIGRCSGHVRQGLWEELWHFAQGQGRDRRKQGRSLSPKQFCHGPSHVGQVLLREAVENLQRFFSDVL